MNTKERILESLEGKRTEAVWDLIEKSVNEIYEEGEKANLEIAKEEYLKNEKWVNHKNHRYILIEQIGRAHV